MLKSLFFFVVRFSGFNYIYSKFMGNRIFIVGYHSVRPKIEIDDSVKKVSVDTKMFEDQIKYLINHGHTIIHFSDLAQIKNKKTKKPTIIYFDDGFKDNVLYVLPILKKYNVTGTFFVVPKFADESGGQYMNWEDIKKLSSSGMEIGSHTYSHAILTSIDTRLVSGELVSSKEKIEKEIGNHITTFSYPKGRFNKDIAELVSQAGYLYAITTQYGTNSFDAVVNNQYVLKKIAPRVYENINDFIVRLYSFNIFYDFRS